MNEYQSLLDFEDQIRLEAIPLDEALEFKKQTQNEMYVVGQGIRDYLDGLRSLGFKDLWVELKKEDKSQVVQLFRKLTLESGERSNAQLMYAYIDYVLKNSMGEIMIFLNPKSGLIAEQEWSGPTYDEIVRALQHFSNDFDRIHFVTGLFDVSGEEFNKKHNVTS